MDYIASGEKQVQEMLKHLGLQHPEELFKAIPEHLKLARTQDDDGCSEYEGLQRMESIAAKNGYVGLDSYLGAGAYEHYQPAIVSTICSKSEFLTCYTPYQAEASQGSLQAIFEYQTAICAITGMEVANASLYDGASACAEALLMAIRRTKRYRVLVAENIHPHYLTVIRQYLCQKDFHIDLIPFSNDGTLNHAAFENLLSEDIAAVLIASPSFFGTMEQVESLFQKAHTKGSLAILCANPLSYGIYRSAGDLGADIAVGDLQPFGIPLNYGGPYAGYLASKLEYVRQMPGRIVGETIGRLGERGYVLTLQPREQHIHREKATSNICTNQALCVVAALVTLAWYGREGFEKWSLTCFQRASFLRDELSKILPTTPFSKHEIFNEFVVNFGKPWESIEKRFIENGIYPGLHLGHYFPDLENHVLVAVTEMKSLEQLQKYIQTAKMIIKEVLV